ncbi:MAG: aldehyde dehydrogenase family protein [Pseudomonadota bacterium]
MQFDRNYTMTINGEAATSSKTIDVVNPATTQIIAQAPDCSEGQLDEAVKAARAAFPEWRDTPIEERANALDRLGDILIKHTDELASLFTAEQGRPLEAAKMEVAGAGQWLKATATLRPPVEIVEDSDTDYVETHYVPLGVVCAIAPWNFPVTLAMVKVAPALLAGNTMVLKPSPFTPLCTLKIGELFRSTLPAGVLNIISGGDQLGPQMTSHPEFDKISFTGSTATGKRVMESAAKDLKKVTLELGGNDAAIVLPDVDVDEIAPHIFMGSFFNTAQVCVATKRLYVHEDVYDALRDRLLAIAEATVVGDGSEQGVSLGPIQNERQYERVLNLLDDARSEGLTLHQVSEVPKSGFFIPITIVDNPPEHARVVQEEAFGPVLPIMKFRDVEEVIDRANASEYGLAGAVWSKDTNKAKDIARRIETGTVWINQNLKVRPDTPFGGHKQSGVGVEFGLPGLLEFMAPQVVMMAKTA